MNVIQDITIQRVLRHSDAGVTKAEIGRLLGIHRDTVRSYVAEYHSERKFISTRGDYLTNLVPEPTVQVLSGPSSTHTYILTAAQNNTAIHAPFWQNLRAYAAHLNARIMVGGFIYRKDAFGQDGQEKAHNSSEERSLQWAPELEPYRADERVLMAPGLEWEGHFNALPTGVDPLSGLTSYSRGASAIYPHVKVAMRPLAVTPGSRPKFLYTTGAVTQPNYIQRRSGMIAEFHHVIGALIVEVDGDAWWVRQINAIEDGSFQDLEVKVQRGRVTSGHSVLSVQWGDIHVAKMEPLMEAAVWGDGGILDTLRPRYQVLHDFFDHEARNHHDIKNPHRMFQKYVSGRDSVRSEVEQAAALLKRASRHWVENIVVESNHNQALGRWLREADGFRDPPNALFWLRGNVAALEAFERGDNFNPVEWGLKQAGAPAATYLTENSSMLIGGIETALHGHRGANGAKGSPKSFTQLATKINTGHTHSASIYDGVYTAGVQGSLHMGYNEGLTSWSHSIILTYETGKRAIVTLSEDLRSSKSAKKYRGA